jgi:hypothetical protein
MRQIGEHAVVLGAGMAGLPAARVPADAYERVTPPRPALPSVSSVDPSPARRAGSGGAPGPR